MSLDTSKVLVGVNYNGVAYPMKQGYNNDIDLLDLYSNFILTDYNIQQLYNGNYFINEETTNGQNI